MSILYIQDQLESRDLWAKCFIANTFTIGIFTTSRAESFNSVIKENVFSSGRLVEILLAFERTHTHIDKMNITINKKERDALGNLTIFKDMYKVYTEHVISKVKESGLKGLDYKILRGTTDEW